MSETILSQRLQGVAVFVPAGSRLLDVGSDHAYLPLYLLEQGQISHAIAGEVVEGPYQAALTNARQSQHSDQLEVRLADGLAAFDATDAINVITICGMGGRLIADILDKGRAKLDGVSRLVLQPNNREDDLRSWLCDHEFRIVAETILEENDKIYEILVVEPGSQNLTALDIRFGPHLRQEKSPTFVKKWQAELKTLETAYAKIPEHHAETRSAMFQKIQAIKEVLHES